MEWKPALVRDEKENLFQIPERWVFLRYYEAFNLLFRIENALRVFVYIILKTEFRDKWSDIEITADEAGSGSIASIAKKRMAQSQSFGYLGHAIACPIMHLTSGELTRLIMHDSYWKFFNKHFRGGKEIIRSKLEEIGSIRNSLAHFRPIKEDDVTAIKHNAKHVLIGVEDHLSQALRQPDVVPTNTDDKWYNQLKTVKNDLCSSFFYQSADTSWVRIGVVYACPVIKIDKFHEQYINYDVLRVTSAAIVHGFPEVRSAVSFVAESIPYIRMPDNMTPNFRKILLLVFNRKTLEELSDSIHDSLKAIIRKVAEESELIQQDNLARGKLVHATRAFASARKTEASVLWNVDTLAFWSPVSPTDPPEYWGRFGGYVESDFIAGTNEYPWMPESISRWESPF